MTRTRSSAIRASPRPASWAPTAGTLRSQDEPLIGATDGTFLSAWTGIPIVTTGAGKREVPHHVDELLAACKLYAATAMYYAYGKETHV